jgi:hypothetical protein
MKSVTLVTRSYGAPTWLGATKSITGSSHVSSRSYCELTTWVRGVSQNKPAIILTISLSTCWPHNQVAFDLHFEIKLKLNQRNRKCTIKIWSCQLSHHVSRTQTPWSTFRVAGFYLPSSVGRKRPPRGDMYDALSRNDPTLGEAQPFHAIPRDFCNISHVLIGGHLYLVWLYA